MTMLPATLPLVWPDPRPRRMTGAVELGLAEALVTGTRPERVTAVICAMFETLSGEPAVPGTVERLSSGTRAWLLAQAAGGGTRWFQAACRACGQMFDLSLSLADLPRGDAGPGFPVAEVRTSAGKRRFQVPNGAHETALARRSGRLPDLLALDGAGNGSCNWDDKDLAAIEAALDAVAPDVADQVACTCPSCGADAPVRIDPLTLISANTETILAEVHLLARAYGWREGVILALPADRRRAYARMIRAEGRAR